MFLLLRYTPFFLLEVKDTKANDRKKAIIGGHYVFGYPEVEELKKSASIELSKKDINVTPFIITLLNPVIKGPIKNIHVISYFDGVLFSDVDIGSKFLIKNNIIIIN